MLAYAHKLMTFFFNYLLLFISRFPSFLFAPLPFLSNRRVNQPFFPFLLLPLIIYYLYYSLLSIYSLTPIFFLTLYFDLLLLPSLTLDLSLLSPWPFYTVTHFPFNIFAPFLLLLLQLFLQYHASSSSVF